MIKLKTYFLEAAGTKNIKIGSTARSGETRRKQLQKPDEALALLAEVDGMYEPILHRMFAADRLNGEWFKPSDLLLQIMSELQNGDDSKVAAWLLRENLNRAQRKEPDHLSFGEVLAGLLKRFNMSSYRLAQTSGLDATFIGRMLRDEMQPGFDTVQKISLALDVSLEELRTIP